MIIVYCKPPSQRVKEAAERPVWASRLTDITHVGPPSSDDTHHIEDPTLLNSRSLLMIKNDQSKDGANLLLSSWQQMDEIVGWLTKATSSARHHGGSGAAHMAGGGKLSGIGGTALASRRSSMASGMSFPHDVHPL